MHLFNPFALAYRLRENALSESEKFGYVMAFTMMALVTGLPSRLSGSRQSTTIAITGAIFYAIVSFIGLRACFSTNARGDNRGFIERWLCLSVPLSIWLNVLPAYLYLAVSWLGFFSGSLFTQYRGLISLIFWIVAGVTFILYFVLLNRLIGIVAGGSPSKNASDFAPIASP